MWPHGDYPLIDVGYFEAEPQPDNYFSEVEQVAMNPANVVPGISFSPDKMLQGPSVLYGVRTAIAWASSHHQGPVSGAKCPFHNYHPAARYAWTATAAAARLQTQQLRPVSRSSRTTSAAATLSIEGRSHRSPGTIVETTITPYKPRRAVQPTERRRHQRMFLVAGELSQVRNKIQRRLVERCSPRCGTAASVSGRWGKLTPAVILSRPFGRLFIFTW